MILELESCSERGRGTTHIDIEMKPGMPRHDVTMAPRLRCHCHLSARLSTLHLTHYHFVRPEYFITELSQHRNQQLEIVTSCVSSLGIISSPV